MFNNWKINSIVLVIVLFIGAVRAHSQNHGDFQNLQFPARSIQGIFTVIFIQQSNSFKPITHFNKNELNVNAVCTYYKIDILRNVKRSSDNPGYEAEGKDLKGISASFNGSYAFTNQIQIFWNYFYNSVSGKVEGKTDWQNQYYSIDQHITQANMPTFEINFRNADFNYCVMGISYDFIDNGEKSKFSVPVYLGVNYREYYIKANYSPTEIDYKYPWATISCIDSSYALTLGLSVSYIFIDMIKIAPFIFIDSIASTGRPRYTTTVTKSDRKSDFETSSRFQVGDSNEYRIDSNADGYLGIYMEVDIKTNLAIYFSISGYINSYLFNIYPDSINEGLRLKILNLGISYKYIP